jgi:hypothetical protein
MYLRPNEIIIQQFIHSNAARREQNKLQSHLAGAWQAGWVK